MYTQVHLNRDIIITTVESHDRQHPLPWLSGMCIIVPPEVRRREAEAMP